MFHNRYLNNKINRLDERCLRLVYNNKQFRIEELLDQDSSFSVHHRNIQMLSNEMCKAKNGSPPEITNKIFQLREDKHYNFRQISQFIVRHVNCVFNGSESVSHMGPKVWELTPSERKQVSSISMLKNKTKSWKPQECPCTICKCYIDGAGFI